MFGLTYTFIVLIIGTLLSRGISLPRNPNETDVHREVPDQSIQSMPWIQPLLYPTEGVHEGNTIPVRVEHFPNANTSVTPDEIMSSRENESSVEYLGNYTELTTLIDGLRSLDNVSDYDSPFDLESTTESVGVSMRNQVVNRSDAVNCDHKPTVECSRNLTKIVNKTKICKELAVSMHCFDLHFKMCKNVSESDRIAGETVANLISQWLKSCLQNETVTAVTVTMDDEERSIEGQRHACIKDEEVKKCDEHFPKYFDAGKDVISSEEECELFSAYKTCVNNVTEDSCGEESTEIKEFVKRTLYSRIRVNQLACGQSEVEEPGWEADSIKIDIKPALESELDIILEHPCREKAKPIVYACIQQYQEGIDTAFRLSQAISIEEPEVLPSLCCTQAKFSVCVYIISMLRCGKDLAKRVLTDLEQLRYRSSPLSCSKYNYESPVCQRVYNGARETHASHLVPLLFLLLLLLIAVYPSNPSF